MTFVQNLWRDLVEKRLWPVAALLVAALVAMPFLVGGGSDSPSKTAAAPLDASAGAVARASVAQVTLDDSISSKATNRAGAVRNPFKPEHVIPPAKTGGTGGAATTTTPATTSPVTKTPVTTPTPSTTTNPSPGTTTPGHLTLYDWLTQVRIGSHTSMKNHAARGVTLLPSPNFILLSYIGVKKDHKTAVFNVSPGTYVSGGGKCLPSASKCAVLELATGESALLTRLAGKSHLKRYRVRVLSVKMHKITDAATNAKAKAARVLSSDDVTSGVAG